MESNIYINGEIGVDYTINDALADYQRVRESEVINLWISSPGGFLDEGLKICELFESSKQVIKTHNLGDVASVAFNIFLIASRENRFYDPERGSLLIHYPWGEAAGNSAEFKEYTEQLQAEENKLVKQLVNKLGIEEAVLRGYMEQERFLTLEEVELLNIANIVNHEFKAVAKLKKDEMTDKEVKQELSGIKKVLEEVKAYFTKPKALMLQDVNGVEINMPEIETIEQLSTGVTATIDGAPANGEYVLDTGEVLVFENGSLTEIKEGENEIEQLRLENENLKKQLEELNAKAKEKESEIDELRVNATAKVEEVTKKFNEFKAKYSKEFVPDGKIDDGDGKPKVRKPFKN
jgi:ATP-dependent protease ClpP protease subunit